MHGHGLRVGTRDGALNRCLVSLRAARKPAPCSKTRTLPPRAKFLLAFRTGFTKD
jgi:hypothetical protein